MALSYDIKAQFINPVSNLTVQNKLLSIHKEGNKETAAYRCTNIVAFLGLELGVIGHKHVGFKYL